MSPDPEDAAPPREPLECARCGRKFKGLKIRHHRCPHDMICLGTKYRASLARPVSVRTTPERCELCFREPLPFLEDERGQQLLPGADARSSKKIVT